MSLNNQTLYNLDAIKALDFDTSATNHLTNATTVSEALVALDEQLVNQNEASEITYDNSTSGLTATNCQTAIDETEARVDTLEASYPIVSLTSASAVKTAYESNADTNAYTDAEQLKLTGIESGATADQTAAEVPYDNTSSGLTATNTQSAIDEVEARVDTAEASYPITTLTSASAVKTAYESNANTNAYTDTEKTNLSNQSGTNTGDQIASTVPFTTTTDLLATEVNSAIEEVKVLAESTPTGVSIEGQSRQVVDCRLDTYGAIYIGAGTAPLDQRSDNGTGTPAALEYTTYGTLGTWNRGRFTADSDGTYHFRWVADQTTNSGIVTHNYQLVKNGSTILFNTEYITSGSRVNSNEIDTYVELSTNDYIEVYVGPNQTAGLICETMYYNVEKVATFSGQGEMETISVEYNNASDGNYNGDTPTSLYTIDSNWKLDLTEGKWLVTWHVPMEHLTNSTHYTMIQTIAGDKVTPTPVSESYIACTASVFRMADSGSAIIDVTSPTSYTWWAYADPGYTGIYYNISVTTPNPDPDNRALLTATKLSAPTVANASSLSYSNVSSGLTATNAQAAIDEIAADTGAGAMSTQEARFELTDQYYFGSSDTSAGTATQDPKSLFRIDSNYKLVLEPGKWQISWHQPFVANQSGSAGYLNWALYPTIGDPSTSPTINDITTNAIVRSNNLLDWGTYSGTIVVEPSVTTTYTLWVMPGTNSNVRWYISDQFANQDDPDCVSILSAVRLSAPSVADASNVVYSNATSGLTATDMQSAVDEIESRVDTVEGATYVNSLNGQTGTVALNKVTTSSGTFTPTEANDIYICDTSSSPVTVNLPEISTLTYGNFKFIFKDNGNCSVNNITINRGGTDLIDGDTSLVITTDYSSITLVADASNNWLVV